MTDAGERVSRVSRRIGRHPWGWRTLISRRSNDRVVGRSGAGVLPTLAILILGIGFPAGLILLQSFDPNPLASQASAEHSLLANYQDLTAPVYLEAVVRTVRYSFLASTLSVIAGTAIVIAFVGLSGRQRSSLWIVLLLVPILSGPVTTVLGWINLFARGNLGYVIVNALRDLAGLERGRVLETEVGMTVGLVHFLIPFVILMVFPVATRIPPELIEASLTLGNTPLSTVRRVILPLVWPAMLAAALVSLAMSLSAFVNPQFLGGSRNLVLTTLVDQFMTSFRPNLASALAVILIAIGFLLVALYSSALRRLTRMSQ